MQKFAENDLAKAQNLSRLFMDFGKDLMQEDLLTLLDYYPDQFDHLRNLLKKYAPTIGSRFDNPRLKMSF